MNYRTLLLHIAFVFFLAVGWTSCSQDEVPSAPTEESTGLFDQLLYSEELTLGETIDAVLQQYGVTEDDLGAYKPILDLVKSININYDVHAITYHTLTPDGKPIVASGMVYYPKTIAPLGVIEISPINKEKGDCGSKNYKMLEVIPGMTGYICLVPDLIGCGVTEELPIAYLQHQSAAQVGADLRSAAADFLEKQYRYKMGSESILFGYSLGGGSILSLARYYQLHPERGVKVEHLFAGGGAYYPRTVLDTQFKNFYSEYAIMPNVLLSMNQYDGLKLDFYQIFKGELAANYQSWCDGYMPISKLTQKLGTDMREYFSETFLAQYNKPGKYERLMNTLAEKAVPEDWVPVCDVHLFHAKDDYYVPIESSDRMYGYLQSVGADVTYDKFEGSHAVGAVRMEVEFFKFLLRKK